jgi:hypothetical protein
VFVRTLFWMALQRHRMKQPGAARTEKAFKINVPSAIVRSIAPCCACSAGCPAMIAWEAAAGPTVHRQGSRCARPAPPACGLDCAPLAQLFAAMRSWLAVSDGAQAARKREVGARQRDVAWTSAVHWIGQDCHSGAMASSQISQPRHAPGGVLSDDLYDYLDNYGDSAPNYCESRLDDEPPPACARRSLDGRLRLPSPTRPQRYTRGI